MRKADVSGMGGSAWLVPRDRFVTWCEEHAGTIEPGSVNTILALAYYKAEGIWSEQWHVVVLRDRIGHSVYDYAELLDGELRYDIGVYTVSGGEPPVNGEGWPELAECVLSYKFTGLHPDHAAGVAYLAIEALCAGSIGLTTHEGTRWQAILTNVVNDYRTGKFGGPRSRALAVDESGALSGRERDEEQVAAVQEFVEAHPDHDAATYARQDEDDGA